MNNNGTVKLSGKRADDIIRAGIRLHRIERRIEDHLIFNERGTVTFAGVSYQANTLRDLHNAQATRMRVTVRAPVKLRRFQAGTQEDAAHLQAVHNSQHTDLLVGYRGPITLHAGTFLPIRVIGTVHQYLMVRAMNRMDGERSWQGIQQFTLDMLSTHEEQVDEYCLKKAIDKRFAHFVSSRVEGFAQGYRA